MEAPLGIDSKLIAFLSPLYAVKDTMHDWSHIERVRRRASEFGSTRGCDWQILGSATCLHGAIEDHEQEIRTFLSTHGVRQATFDRIVCVAHESQKASAPQTLEGRVLHDAHMLEGDENFLITKMLMTGAARGQSLAQTLTYFEATVGRYRCCFAQYQRELARREEIAREYVRKLKSEL